MLTIDRFMRQIETLFTNNNMSKNDLTCVVILHSRINLTEPKAVFDNFAYALSYCAINPIDSNEFSIEDYYCIWIFKHGIFVKNYVVNTDIIE